MPPPAPPPSKLSLPLTVQFFSLVVPLLWIAPPPKVKNWALGAPYDQGSDAALTLYNDAIDAEVLEFFKDTGERYQSRINAVLRSYVEAHKVQANAQRRQAV